MNCTMIVAVAVSDLQGFLKTRALRVEMGDQLAGRDIVRRQFACASSRCRAVAYCVDRHRLAGIGRERGRPPNMISRLTIARREGTR